jgi:tetratricopeptide (TPR) repeat protein
LAVIVIVFAVRTFLRNFDWDNDIALWSKAAQACPDSFKSHKSLAFALYEKMDPAGRDIDRIIEEGERAAEITDRAQIVFLHLGAYYRIKGDLLAQRAADGSLIPSPEGAKFYEKSVGALQRAVPLDRTFNDDNKQKELRRGRKPEQIPDIGNHEIYWNLGLSLMRIGKTDEALAAYTYMRHLAPGNADAYLSLASVQIAKNQFEEAAVNLLQALLLDNNRQEALRTLISIYRQIDREGCALDITPGQSAPRLNANCTIVRKHICLAYYGLVQAFVETKQYALAQSTRQNALTAYNCAPEPFNQFAIPVSSPTAPTKP